MRLERLKKSRYSESLLNFNSIKVRLEQSSQIESINSIRNFNSIKVRLELKKTENFSIILSLFQFHKGAIRTNVGLAQNASVPEFQFHKGAIRTYWCYS